MLTARIRNMQPAELVIAGLAEATLEEAAADLKAKREADAAQAAPLVVLVVDDNAVNLKALPASPLPAPRFGALPPGRAVRPCTAGALPICCT